MSSILYLIKDFFEKISRITPPKLRAKLRWYTPEFFGALGNICYALTNADWALSAIPLTMILWKNFLLLGGTLSVIGWLIGIYLRYDHESHQRDSESELNELYEMMRADGHIPTELVSNHLAQLANEHNLGDGIRLSVYVHLDKQLIQVGKYSLSKDYHAGCVQIHRNDGVNIVSKSLNDGFQVALISEDGVTFSDAYQNEVRTKCGFTKKSHFGRMNSRSLAVYPLVNSQRQRFAAIVWESTDKTADQSEKAIKATEKKVKSVFDPRMSSLLRKIEIMHTHGAITQPSAVDPMASSAVRLKVPQAQQNNQSSGGGVA